MKLVGLVTAFIASFFIVASGIVSAETVDKYDEFGVKKIYQTAVSGREWYLSSNPSSDSQFNSDLQLTKNSDGSWKVGKTTSIKDTPVRLTAMTPSGKTQWKNVEITGYVKLSSYSIPEEFTWQARGAVPNGGNPCSSSALEGYVTYQNGQVGLKKKIWHTGGYTEERGVVSGFIGPLKDRWVGIKVIFFNSGEDVKMEIWLDKLNDNNWVKATQYSDSGGWLGGSINNNCKDLSGNTRSLDEKVVWNGPDVSFRADNAIFNFERLSVREIDGSDYLGTTSTSFQRRFIGSVYTTSSDSKAISEMKQVWTDPKNVYDLILEDTDDESWAEAFPNHKTMIGSSGLNFLINGKILQAGYLDFGPNDIIYYDPEAGYKTPLSEQNSIAASTKKACDIVHSAGYKCGFTPELTKEILAQLPDVDWDNVDVLVIQSQRFSRYPIATEELKNQVNSILSYAKTDNPNLKAIVQISIRQASNCWDYRYDTVNPDTAGATTVNNPDCVLSSSQTMSNLKGTVNELAKIPKVNGVMITYLPRDYTTGSNDPGYVCPQTICNPTNLREIISFIRSIKV